MKAEMSPPIISIEMKPHHLFRYPSEWDPRQNGKTKGGYLEGKIILPKTKKNLRVLVSTHPEKKHEFKKVNASRREEEIHPTLIHVVRKGRGNRRFNEKEPVPNINHWQQEFEIIDKKVFIRNKTSSLDEQRHASGSERILPRDEMFTIKDDMVLNIGKDFGALNMIILIPKTEKRANSNDVSLNKLLQSRTNNIEAINVLSEHYRGKNTVNLKKVKLKVEIFCLDTGESLGSSLSCAISDTASKAHGAMDLHDVTPLRSCAVGGRKIVMIAEFGLAKDVEPKYQLYDKDDRRLHEQENLLLIQPTEFTVLKESIIFITPAQPHADKILLSNYKIKLVARRDSDGYVSRKKFDFNFVPHDYYQGGCIFCNYDPDRQTENHGPAKLVPMNAVARPGVRKRQMSDTDRDSPEMYDMVKIKKTLSPQAIDVKPIFSSARSVIVNQRSVSQRLILVDPSNNISTTTAIKQEPEDESESNNLSSIPFHDLSSSAVVRTFNPAISESLIIPTTSIKKE